MVGILRVVGYDRDFSEPKSNWTPLFTSPVASTPLALDPNWVDDLMLRRHHAEFGLAELRTTLIAVSRKPWTQTSLHFASSWRALFEFLI